MKTIKAPKGLLDGKNAGALVEAMKANDIYTLDFEEVTDISFAALRALLNCRQAGKNFMVVHAEAAVAEKFEDTGVSYFINVCRKPKMLDMSKYEEFGHSFLSKAFNSADGDSMIKIYGERVKEPMVLQEKVVARAVMQFGIPTPLVGSVYSDGKQMGIDFERIEGKRSFSRIMADEPERLEEMSVRFAQMCKKLHSTPCDTNIFADRKSFYIHTVENCKELDPALKAKVMAFLNTIPDAATCLHGDMQMSNIITTPSGQDMWIDLSDFGYGYPLLDLGMLVFQVKFSPEPILQDLFHFGKEKMDKFWTFFVKEYFGADTPAKKAEVDGMLMRYAALHMLYLGATYGFEPFMMPVITDIFSR